MRIGVLGGTGPEATAEFYRKLIVRLQSNGVKSNTDFPQIIINSIPAPEIIDHHATLEELAFYLDGLKELDSFGVDFIVMVCNTIHIYHEFLQDRVNTHIIDLRKYVLQRLRNEKIKSLLILGTRGTIESGLYEFDDISTVRPSEEEINYIAKIVSDFNRGIREEKKLIEICRKHADRIDCVLFGCTEIAILLDSIDVKKINTIDVLVEATINSINIEQDK